MTATTYLASWAVRVAQDHLAVDLPQRWAHVLGCRRQAGRIGPRLLAEEERELLVAAALLHDIGYADTLARSGFHPLDGARFLARAGAPPRLCNLVARNSAAAVTARLRGLGAELAVFPDEHSALRDALWFCDMTTDPHGREVPFDERLAEIRLRHGPGSVQVRSLDAGGLTTRVAAVRRTVHRLRLADRVPSAVGPGTGWPAERVPALRRSPGRPSRRAG